jgi:hypothetical protein
LKPMIMPPPARADVLRNDLLSTFVLINVMISEFSVD